MSKRPFHSQNAFSASSLVPLALDPPKKPLPLTPPEIQRVRALEYENAMLGIKNEELKSDIEGLSYQVQHYQQLAEAAKAFFKTASASVRHLQDATTRMKEVETAARNDWDGFYAKGLVSHRAREADISKQQFF